MGLLAVQGLALSRGQATRIFAAQTYHWHKTMAHRGTPRKAASLSPSDQSDSAESSSPRPTRTGHTRRASHVAAINQIREMESNRPSVRANIACMRCRKRKAKCYTVGSMSGPCADCIKAGVECRQIRKDSIDLNIPEGFAANNPQLTPARSVGHASSNASSGPPPLAYSSTGAIPRAGVQMGALWPSQIAAAASSSRDPFFAVPELASTGSASAVPYMSDPSPAPNWNVPVNTPTSTSDEEDGQFAGPGTHTGQAGIKQEDDHEGMTPPQQSHQTQIEQYYSTVSTNVLYTVHPMYGFTVYGNVDSALYRTAYHGHFH